MKGLAEEVEKAFTTEGRCALYDDECPKSKANKVSNSLFLKTSLETSHECSDDAKLKVTIRIKRQSNTTLETNLQ